MGRRSAARAVEITAAATLLVCATPAHAREAKPWQVGAGAGAIISDGGAGPAFAAQGTYSLGSFFDAMVDLTFAFPRRDGLASYQLMASGGFLYKLDVFEWVPYAGALMGYSWFRQTSTGLTLGGPVLSVPFGLDYVFDGSLSVGIQGGYRWLLLSPDPAIVDRNLWTVIARAEYRFGW